MSGGKLRNEHMDTASKLVDKTSEQIRLISLAREKEMVIALFLFVNALYLKLSFNK